MSAALGTLQFWKISSRVSEARMPSFISFLPSVNPGRPLSTSKAEMPLFLSSGAVETKTRKKSAKPALVTHAFVPLSR